MTNSLLTSILLLFLLVANSYLFGQTSRTKEFDQCLCETADFVLEKADLSNQDIVVKKLTDNFYEVFQYRTLLIENQWLSKVILKSTYYRAKCDEDRECYIPHGVFNHYGRLSKLAIQDFYFLGKQIGLSAQYNENIKVQISSCDTIALSFHKNGLLNKVNLEDNRGYEFGLKIELDSVGNLVTIGDFSKDFIDSVWSEDFTELFIIDRHGDTLASTFVTEANVRQPLNNMESRYKRNYKKTGPWFFYADGIWFYENW